MLPKIKLIIYILINISLLVNGVSAQRKVTTQPQKKTKPQQSKQPTVVKNSYNWNPIFLGSNIKFINDNTDSYLYAKDSFTLYKSNDFGKNWSVVFAPPELITSLSSPGMVCDPPSLIFKQSKTNPQIMYIASQGDVCGNSKRNSDIWRSIDGGANWTNMTNGSLERRIVSLSISPKNPDIIYFTLLRGTRVGWGNNDVALLKSANGGKNSAVITPNGTNGYHSLEVSVNPFNEKNIILLDGEFSPKETTDGGVTWHEMQYNLVLKDETDAYRRSKLRYWTSLWFHPTDENIRIARITKGNINGASHWHLVITRDGGNSWKDISPAFNNYYWRFDYRVKEPSLEWINSITFSQSEKEKIYAGNERALFVSSNLGQDWERISNEGIYSVIESKDGKNINISTNFGLLQTDNNFTKWLPIGNGLSSGDSLSPVKGHPLDEARNRIFLANSFDDFLYLVKANGDLAYTSDTKFWILKKNIAEDVNTITNRTGAPLKINQIFNLNDSITFLVANRGNQGANTIFKISGSGIKSELILPANIGYKNTCYCGIGVSQNDSKRIYLYSDKKLHISDDGGTTWRESLNNGADSVVVSPKDSNHAYAILKANPNSLNAVVSTTDGGKTWYAGETTLADVALNLGIPSAFRTLTMNPNNPNIIYVTSEKGIFFSKDTGNSWNLAANTPINGKIYNLVISREAESEMFVLSSSGIHNTKDSGKTWIPFNNGISNDEQIYQVVSSKNYTIAVGQNKIYRLEQTK